jgi:peptide/nickel transport system permease protein
MSIDWAVREHRSLWADAWRRLISLNTARLGMVIIGGLLLVAVLAPIVSPYNPKTDSNLRERLKPPSRAHILGTDNLGRDVVVRLVHGARYSLMVGIISVSMGLLIGGILGLLAGFVGGAVDNIIMRVMDIVLAFPAMLLAIAIVAMRGPGLNNTMVAVGVVFIPIFARLARSMVLSIREQEYVTAATCAGVTRARILFRHILPNILSPIIVQSTLGLGSAILWAERLLQVPGQGSLVGHRPSRCGHHAQRAGLQPARRRPARRARPPSANLRMPLRCPDRCWGEKGP